MKPKHVIHNVRSFKLHNRGILIYETKLYIDIEEDIVYLRKHSSLRFNLH